MASKPMKLELPNTIICELCSESYTDPRVLPCLHSFCKECLEKEAEKAGSQQSLKCPASKCNKSLSLPEGGIGALPRNLYLTFSVEIAGYKARMEGSSDVGCDSCVDSSSGPAVAFCIECCEFLCKPCRDHHRRARKTLKHELVNTGEEKGVKPMEKVKPKGFLCTEPMHEGELLKFYCKTCQQLICRDCVVIKHKDHEHGSLPDVAKCQKHEIKSLFEPVREAIHALDNATSSSDKMIQQVQSRSKSVDCKIEQVFGQLKKSIETRKSELLAKSREICMAKVTALTLQRSEFLLLQQELKTYTEAAETTLQTHTNEQLVALGRLFQTELKMLLDQFESTSFQLCESDAMPICLNPAALLESNAMFGVVSGGCSPAHSTASINILGAVKNRKREFRIVTRCENGQPFDLGGEDVKAELCLMGSTDPPVRGETTDNGDGMYSVTIIPQFTGEHKLSITIHNQPIKGSPFPISVREPRDYATSPQQSLSNLGSQAVYSLAIHDNGDIYITQNNYIRIVNPVDGSTRATLGSSGSGERQFSTPEAIALRGDYMFIADMGNHRIQKIRATGNHEFISQFGKNGSGDEEFSSPRGICLDPEGRIFVSDHNNNRVQVFEADGTFAYKIPQDNSDKAKVTNPWGLTFDPIGHLHVVSHGTSTIKVFTPEGKFLEEYGQGKLSDPAGITIDEEGYVIVTERTSSGRVQIFRPDSHESIETLTGFSYPQSVVSSKEGFIYVGDRDKHRIQKY